MTALLLSLLLAQGVFGLQHGCVDVCTLRILGPPWDREIADPWMEHPRSEASSLPTGHPLAGAVSGGRTGHGLRRTLADPVLGIASHRIAGPSRGFIQVPRLSKLQPVRSVPSCRATVRTPGRLRAKPTRLAAQEGTEKHKTLGRGWTLRPPAHGLPVSSSSLLSSPAKGPADDKRPSEPLQLARIIAVTEYPLDTLESFSTAFSLSHISPLQATGPPNLPSSVALLSSSGR
ncbi:hypothetical protein VTN02DRAFT_2710 [Thermoascus thermophilus]